MTRKGRTAAEQSIRGLDRRWVYRHYDSDDGRPAWCHRKARRLVLLALRLLPPQVSEEIRRGNPRLTFMLPAFDGDLCETRGRNMDYQISIGLSHIEFFNDTDADSTRWHSTILLHEIGHAVCGHDCIRRFDETADDEYLRLQIEADQKLIEWGQREALVEWLEALVRHSQELLVEDLPEDLNELRARVGEARFLEWQESARHQLEHDLPRLEAALELAEG